MQLIQQQMINQSDQASNQYGFYAVPKALEPKKKYRETYDEESKYSEEEDQEEEPQFQTIEKQAQNERQIERDFYVDEAPYPQFKPKERGLDYGVQIQRHELFDFDLEVQPLVEILVGRSVVSAINELQEEKQRNEREENLDVYQKKRNAQLMQTQRMQNKHNRLQDQAKRRVLQKDTFVKNRKIATQKLVARKNAKHSLLNLRSQIIGQLQEEGFLRESTYLNLRVRYEGWLYEQIKAIVNENRKIQQAANTIVREKQKQVKGEHQKHIEIENKRRKDILDERERIRKQNQQRRQKKRIRKQRLNLNTIRQATRDQIFQQVNKYEQVQKILKSQSLSNGLTRRRNTAGTVHLAGGLLNFILTMINASGKHTAQQIQTIIQKLLGELFSKLQVQVSTAHLALIEQARARMQADPVEFMNSKNNIVQELAERVSLDIRVLEAVGVSLNSQVHSNVINVLLNIYLTVLPVPKAEPEEGAPDYQPTEKDKKRDELKNKVEFVGNEGNNLNQLKKVDNAVRIRFEREEIQSKQDEKSEQNQQQNKQVNLDEWIDVYDGKNWQKTKQQSKQIQRQTQNASSYVLSTFPNSFVVDERNLHYLQIQLQRLLGIQGGEELTRYRDRLEHLLGPDDKLPIFDIQLVWEAQK